MFDLRNIEITIIGLGYVGLPLAVEFSKKYNVIGYDINDARVRELESHEDSTGEVTKAQLQSASKLKFSGNIKESKDSDVYIVTVPTPIDSNKQPNLAPLIKASEIVGSVLTKNNIVIYESTVYPGATEDDCIPVVEKVSGLKLNKDFFCGYSPERINPGDRNRGIKDIVKVTSGSTPEIAEHIDALYRSIIESGTHKAPSIKVAEGAKVIENVQRDVNIALINEIHQIFTNMGVNPQEVIEAAATKWNFMSLKPGLVGGHCIGVDPYYLLHKSEEKGYIPDLMRMAREINDSMPNYLAYDFLKRLMEKRINPIGLDVALLGFTFKENCPDIRNTKVFDLYVALKSLGFRVKIYDPIASAQEVFLEYKLEIENNIKKVCESVLFLTVGHTQIISMLKEDAGQDRFIYDFKNYLL